MGGRIGRAGTWPYHFIGNTENLDFKDKVF